MQLNELPFYPYPKDAPTRFGFIIGDLITASILLLFVVAIFPTLIR
jgi:hypothetical protein